MTAQQTFTNLSEERQQEIIRVCLEEFAFNDYHSASLTAIIKNLELAKGSFYRYFESKKTLYFFLLDYAVERRMKSDSSYIKSQPADIFELIILHFKARLHFDREDPLPSAFLYNILREKNSPEIGNIKAIRKQKALDIMYKVVDKYVGRGQIRPDLDKKIAAWHVLETQLSVMDYIELHYNQDFQENMRNRKQLYDLPEEELVAIATQFVEIQKNGFTTYDDR